MDSPPARRTLPVYPSFLSAFVVLHYAVHNGAALYAGHVVPWMIGSAVFPSLLTFALSRVMGGGKAAALSALAVGIFFVGGNSLLDGAFAALALVCGALFLKLERGLEELTTFANIGSGVLVAFQLSQLVLAGLAAPPIRPGVLDTPLPLASVPAKLPDIWLFLLDGHARADVLADTFGAADETTAALEARGFAVPRRSRANYTHTEFAIASMLNLDYLPELVSAPPEGDVAVDGTLRALIRHSRAIATLRAAGYRIATTPTEYSRVDVPGADVRGPGWPWIDEFNGALLSESILPVFCGLLTGRTASCWLDLRRRQIDAGLAFAEREDSDPRPTFHYVHLLVPHPPFSIDRDGSPRASTTDISDGDDWYAIPGNTREGYRTGYAGQVAWLDRRLLGVIDTLLASEDPPIILLQGDHGSASQLHFDDPAPSDEALYERTAALAAWRIPEPAAIGEVTSPVNLFRIVFNQVLGADLPLLPDRSYHNTESRPWDFRDVTGIADRTEPRP